MNQQKERSTTRTPEDQVDSNHSSAQKVGRTAVVTAEADAILDDIDTILEELEADVDKDTSILDEMDAVLEENAQEVVEGFVQKGGQ